MYASFVSAISSWAACVVAIVFGSAAGANLMEAGCRTTGNFLLMSRFCVVMDMDSVNFGWKARPLSRISGIFVLRQRTKRPP